MAKLTHFMGHEVLMVYDDFLIIYFKRYYKKKVNFYRIYHFNTG
jgi:hypothetical protein